MNKICKRSAALILMLLLAVATFAVPAKPGLKRLLTLTDGTTVTATLVGDEHGHYWLGADGKAYQSTDGNVYQEIDAQVVKQHAAKRRAAANQRRSKRLAPKKVGEVGSITGDKKGIIILVNFKNKSFTATQNDFYKLANQVNYNEGNYKGSMRDYFYAQSDGQFRLTFDVVGPYTVSQDYAYYGENDSNGDDKHPAEMIIEALQLANDDVNFANYDWDNDSYVDQVYVVYAGKGAADGGASNTIWPHEWTLSSAAYYGDGTGKQSLDGVYIDTYACGGEQDGQTGATAGIGTMCHEFSHCLGYPDFYDTTDSGGQGMGYWDLMDSGSYNGDGYRPAGYTSYERWVAGWKTPTPLVNTQTISNMPALQDNGSSAYIIYNKGNNNEYYLLENRQQTGWDTDLPGEGLLILHVDYDATAWSNNTPNGTPSHQRMTWVAADNQYQYTTSNGTKYYSFSGMANDPFPYGNVNAFNKTTTPAATLYNNNSDGTKYLDSSVENITQNSNGTISFNFVGISNVATPTFSPAAGQYADAQTVSISCTTNGATIYYTLDGTTPSTSSSVYSSALTISETTTVKAIAMKDNEESAVATAKYTIGGSSSDPNTKKFKLVTSVSEMKSGMRYIIACGSEEKAAGALSNQILGSESVTVSSDVTTISDDVSVFVLEGDQTNGWTFQNESSNEYLYATAAKKLAYSSTANTWALSNGTAGVIMTYGSCGTMLYNVNSPRFTTYTSNPTASMIQANLYKEYSDGSTTTTTPELITDPDELSFEAEANASQVKTFGVLGADLTGNVTVSVTEGSSVFSVSPSTISKADAEEGATVSVTFAPTAAGSSTGTVTVSSEGAEPVTVTLTGTAGSSTTTNYYQPADGNKGETLKTELFKIIKNLEAKSYNYLWTAFYTTDVRSDGKIWDMYSNATNYEPGGSAQGANFSEEGDSYNREHSFPKSWFGVTGNNIPKGPGTDLHHVYPTDGYVNNRRSNYPFGETNGGTYKSNNDFSKLGTCTYPGYTGIVFEPADEYKGDFARTYFYMVTCYENDLPGWYTSNSESQPTLDGNKYPGLSEWQLNMLMEWAKTDRVSEKEINRNNAVYAIQGNRNPFIDYPGLQEYIWGNLTTTDFSYDNYLKPVNIYFSASTATATEGEAFTAPTLTLLPSGLSATFSSSDTSVATVDASTGNVTPIAPGTTIITASYSGNENYIGSASYTLTVNSSLPLPTAPTNLELADVSSTSMTASWSAATNAESYEIDVVEGSSFEASTGAAVLEEDFYDTTGWELSGTGQYTGSNYCGEGSPSIKFDTNGDYAISPDFGSGAKLQFWALGNNGSGSTFAISGLVNNSWTEIETVTIAQGGSTYEVNLPSGTSKVRFDFTKSVNCALDDVIVYGPSNNPETLDGYPKNVGNVTSYAITGLTPETQYAVRVRAVNAAGNSDWSSTATATTTVANSAPVWSALPANVSINVGEGYDLTISDYVSGIPTPTIAMTASDSNDADFDDGYFVFYPTEAGTFSFTFTATNSEGSATATLTVTVTQPPVTVPTLAVNMEGSTKTTVPVSWNACEGVTSYTLQLASDDQFSTGGTSGGTATTILSEDFSGVTSTGTNAISNFDECLNTTGWSGEYVYPNNGNVRLGKSSGAGSLQTPSLSASGSVTVEWDAYQWSGDNTSIYVGVSEDDGTSFVEEVVNLTDNSTSYSKSFTINGNSFIVRWRSSGSSKKRFYLDNISISSGSSSNTGIGSLIKEETVSGTSYTFSNLTPETTYYARVKGNEGWSDVEQFTTNTAITFANNADNNDAINGAVASGKRYDVTLSDRTLYKDGAWNTLCLPFNMTAQQVTAQLAPTSLKELDTETGNYDHVTGVDGSTLYLNFKDASNITAGTPYIIKWTGGSNIVNPTFTGVTISNATNNVSFTGGQFLGTYGYQEFTEDNKRILFMGEQNTLNYPQNGATIGAFRAYFLLDDTHTAGDPVNGGSGQQVKDFVLNFGDESTGIKQIGNGQSSGGNTLDAWYTLQGIKLSKKPTKPGVYIYNGRRWVIK